MSMVPSRVSVRSTDTDCLSMFDDLMHNHLSIDNDLFTSDVYKRNYRSRGCTSSSPFQHPPSQARTRRASTTQAEPNPPQQRPSTRSFSVSKLPTEFENLKSAADAHPGTSRDPQAAKPLSSSEADKPLSPHDLHLAYAPCEASQVSLTLVPRPASVRSLEKLQDRPEPERIESGEPFAGVTAPIRKNDELEPVLLDACHYGAARLVEELLGAGVSVHCRKKEADGQTDGSTPMHLAAMYGHAQVARILLEHDALVNDHHHGERRPLHETAETGDDTMTALLLENGARPYLRDSRGLEPLHLACQHGSMKVATFLLNAGSAVNATDNSLYRPMHYLAQECDDPYLATMLIDVGFDIDATTIQGYSALQLACISGNFGVLAVLLHHGASLASPRWSASPLNLAIRGGHLRVIQLLLRHGAQVNDIDPVSHSTVSHLLVKEAGPPRMVKKILGLLLEHGMDINAQDAEGNTSLHVLIANYTVTREAEWQLIVVKALLANGARAGIANYRGDYPLTLAYRLVLAEPHLDFRPFRLLVAASIHHLPSKRLARIERDMRRAETPATRRRSKEMVALLCTARIRNVFDLRTDREF
ncbi:MAG: hypothetical protein Q9172_007503 [Xanthocarpia lactea]